MDKHPLKIFLDANILIQAGKPPGRPIFTRLVDLVNAGFVEVFITDLTKAEVIRKHVENDYDAVKDITRPHFRLLVKEIFQVDVPEVTKDKVREKLSKKYTKEVESMLHLLKANILSIDAIKPSIVFEQYGQKQGFFSGEGKKDQFPDAFIFEALKAISSVDSPIVIVSQDQDFDAPCKVEENISVVRSVKELFESLDLQVDTPDVESFLDEQHEEIKGLFNSEFKNWGLQASDVEDAEIEDQDITEIELVDLISFGAAKGGNSVLVIGQVKIKAKVSYTHPNWGNAIYDSEDKVLVPFEDVSGDAEIETEADFSMTILLGKDGTPQRISELDFLNDDFIWVELHPYDQYDYM